MDNHRLEDEPVTRKQNRKYYAKRSEATSDEQKSLKAGQSIYVKTDIKPPTSDPVKLTGSCVTSSPAVVGSVERF